MQEIHAGYVSAALWEKVVRKKDLDGALDWRAILRGLSHFVIDKELQPTSKIDPLVAVLTNLLARGLPTLPSLFVEQELAKRTGLTRVGKIGGTTDTQAYETVFTEDFRNIRELLEQALCTFAHGAEVDASPGFSLPGFDSQAERQFFEGPLAEALGPILQLVERQRPFETIVTNKGFKDQRVDFCLEFPGIIDKSCRGFIFELDGPLPYHNKLLDDRRNEVSRNAGWVTIRTPVASATGPLQQHPDLGKILTHPYSRRLSQNVAAPLHTSPIGRQILDLVVTPLAIARLHAVLLLLVRAGKLKLDAEMWRICVVEREYPCASLAAKDFSFWFSRLFELYAPDRNIPKIEVATVSPENQHSLQSALTKANGELFDALLDVSVLQRYGTTKDLLPRIPAGIQITIRTGYRPLQEPSLVSAEPVEPKVTGEVEENALTFFMRNIFRKSKFREGQLAIIRRTLRNNSSIVLLPTGAGKSLTYQLSALLQNGLVIIIDPIKALMKDQVDNLYDIGIDCAAFINSTMKAPERKRVGNAFASGHYKFLFVSPERLLIEEFRNQLRVMNGHLFCFAVVDEAHCVSEWGHDFRTAYLRLGENLRRHCVCPNRKIPILALTGTASYEVLDDIRRELQLSDNDTEIRPKKMARDELKFKLVSVPFPDFPRNTDKRSTSKRVAEAKQKLLPKELENIADYFHRKFDQLVDPNKEDHGTGLIFCPHARGKHGVKDIRDCVASSFPNVRERLGIYSGKISEEEILKAQNDFKKGAITVLVCTKAFGMGIDKPNIRFTVHFNFPMSIESFYQEAGRAGRDRKEALCYILYGGNSTSQTPSVDFSLMETLLRNSFRGPEHEIRMIEDLLDRIHVPNPSPTMGLSDYLTDIYGIQVRCNPYPRQNPNIIYVNNRDNGKTLGKISLYNLAIEQLLQGDSEAHEVMTKAVEWLRKNRPPNNTLTTLVGMTVPGEDRPGLEEMLANLKVGQEEKVDIPFDNGLLDELTQYLRKNYPGQYWTEDNVTKAYEFAFEVDTFIEKLKWDADFTKQISDHIREIFPHIRTEAHTSRAIYRLAILGVIKDYTYDYNTKTIKVTLVRRYDDDITGNLKEYIKHYVSRQEAQRVPKEVKQEDAPTVLRKAAKRLIRFVYEKIFSKRKESLRTMENTIQAGVKDPKLFTERVFLYFDSKYTQDMRPFVKEYSSDTVFEWWNSIDTTPQNMGHLLGSCDVLLNENDKNEVLHILRASALALLPGYTETDVLQELQKAVDDFRQREGWSNAEEQSFLTKLLKKVTDSDPSRIGPFGAVLVNTHVRWLQKFNPVV